MWRDSKVVVVFSADFAQSPTSLANRYSRVEHKRIQISRLQAVTPYNETMDGVDLMDKHKASCKTAIRGKKWYFPIWIDLLDINVSNAWILYKLFIVKGKKI